MGILKIKSQNRNLFFMLLAAYGVYVLPIILTNRLFNDDLARHLYGYTGWNGDGRPLTEFVWKLLGNQIPLSDIFPLPLLLSIALLAYSVTLYAQNRNLLFDYMGYNLIFLIPVILNPFFLTNLSYRYDCITMTLSIVVIVIYFSIPEIKSIPNTILGILVTITGLCLYQATAGAYAAFVLFELVLAIVTRKKFQLRSNVEKVVAFGMGGLIYKLTISPFFMTANDWRNEASKVVAISSESYIVMKGNLKRLLVAILELEQEIPLWIVCLLILGVILLVILAVRQVFKNRLNSPAVRILCSGVILLAIPVTVFLNFAPLIALAKFEERSRIFITLFDLPLLLLILAQSRKRFVEAKECTIKEKSTIGRTNGLFKAATLALIPMICFCYLFSYTYGNVMADQKSYETYLAYRIAGDIEDASEQEMITIITFVGTTPLAPYVKAQFEKYPRLQEMVPIYITNSPWLGGVWIDQFLYKRVHYADLDEVAANDKGKLMFANGLYSGYLTGERLVIYWNERTQGEIN